VYIIIYMPEYTCPDCEKTFDNKSKYERHMNRQNKCTKMTAYKKRKLKKQQEEEKLNNIIAEKIKKEIELLKNSIMPSNTTNNTTNNITNDNSIVNNTNNTNNDNSVHTTNNINLLQYINNNYPNAKNFEDCFRKENITEEMKSVCDGKYYYDGAVYLITELSTKDETTRPIHCTDASRRNFLVKREGKWASNS
jgi:hypothetical protein